MHFLLSYTNAADIHDLHILGFNIGVCRVCFVGLFDL